MAQANATATQTQLSPDPKWQHDEEADNITDEQTAFAEQYYSDEQQHWADSYGGDADEKPPTRGGWIKKEPDTKPKPAPAPVNNNPK